MENFRKLKRHNKARLGKEICMHRIFMFEHVNQEDDKTISNKIPCKQYLHKHIHSQSHNIGVINWERDVVYLNVFFFFCVLY